MQLIRTTHRLHTIQEWLSADAAIRSEVLRHIKLKDRLYRFLQATQQSSVVTQPHWVGCRECRGVGSVLVEPRYDGIHPSQLPHPCSLKIFNEMLGVVGERKHESKLLLIFDLGTAIHKMFQGYGLRGAWGPYYKEEAPISGEFQDLAADLMLEGSADADNILIIEDIPGAVIEVGLVHEYKSINSNGFEKLTRPKSEHKAQAIVYSAALNRPIVVYMYLNKNDCNVADFPVPFDPELWNKTNQKAGGLVQYYNQWEEAKEGGRVGQLPPAEPGFHCKDCGFHKNCAPYKVHLSSRK